MHAWISNYFPRRLLMFSIAAMVLVACGDDAKKEPQGLDTEDTVGSADTAGAADTTTSNDTAATDVAVAADVVLPDAAVTDTAAPADVAVTDTTAPADVAVTDTAASGSCDGTGGCVALNATTCAMAGACTLATTEFCAVRPCHEALGKNNCEAFQPACVWNEEFQSCKYSDAVNCATLNDMGTCRAIGGCFVQSVTGACGGGTWECHTLAMDAAGGYEAGCQALVTAGFACTWTP